MSRNKKIIYFICAVLIVCAIWNLFLLNKSTDETNELYSSLAENIDIRQTEAVTETAKQTRFDDIESGQKIHTDKTEQTECTETAEQDKQIVNEWLLDMKSQNDELAGWITIPNTVINYPVMQTDEDNDFYLTHDFEGNTDSHGTPFADVKCKIGESDTLIIYGHHMADGTMFQNLMKYKNAGFCETNGNIQFYTPEKSFSYEVKSVLVISAEEAEKFRYYEYTDFADESEYNDFFSKCRSYSVWNSEKVPDYGKDLLILSTCEYSKRDGRLVVIAGRTD